MDLSLPFLLLSSSHDTTCMHTRYDVFLVGRWVRFGLFLELHGPTHTRTMGFETFRIGWMVNELVMASCGHACICGAFFLSNIHFC